MKKGLMNLALDESKKITRKALDLIHEDSKGVIPFGSRPMNDKLKLKAFDSLDINDLTEYRNQNGDQAYFKLLSEMDSLRRRVYGLENT